LQPDVLRLFGNPPPMPGIPLSKAEVVDDDRIRGYAMCENSQTHKKRCIMPAGQVRLCSLSCFAPPVDRQKKIGAPPLVRPPDEFAATLVALHLVSEPHREASVRKFRRRGSGTSFAESRLALALPLVASAIVARPNATFNPVASTNELLGPMSRS